jgi:hypothetical protein
VTERKHHRQQKTAFDAFNDALDVFEEHPPLEAQRNPLGPLYAACEKVALGASGDLDRGREALERTVRELAEGGTEWVGAGVRLARDARQLGETFIALGYEALAHAAALEPAGAELERVSLALRRSAERLGVLLLVVSARDEVPSGLARLARSTTRVAVVGSSSLEPWQVRLRQIFKRPPWAVANPSQHRFSPPQEPQIAASFVRQQLLAYADDVPSTFSRPTERQLADAASLLRQLKIDLHHPGGGWVTPFGAAKRFAACFDCDTFPRKEAEAMRGARAARRKRAQSRAQK